MKTEPKIGKLISGTSGRDAIHIAIAPVVASEYLNPGAAVGFVAGSTSEVTLDTKTIGIIDPFLTKPVQKGQSCYLFLFPGTITSLNHQWTHPAFADEAPVNQKGLAEQYIEHFAEKHGWRTADLLEVCGIYAKDSCCDDTTAERLSEIPAGEWEAFWPMWEAFTGTTADQKPTEYFRCAC